MTKLQLTLKEASNPHTEEVKILVRNICCYLPESLGIQLVSKFNQALSLMENHWEIRRASFVRSMEHGILPFFYYLTGVVSTYTYCNTRDFQMLATILSNSADDMKSASKTMLGQLKDSQVTLDQQTKLYNNVSSSASALVHTLELANLEAMKARTIVAPRPTIPLSSASSHTHGDHNGKDKKMKIEPGTLRKLSHIPLRSTQIPS